MVGGAGLVMPTSREAARGTSPYSAQILPTTNASSAGNKGSHDRRCRHKGQLGGPGLLHCLSLPPARHTPCLSLLTLLPAGPSRCRGAEGERPRLSASCGSGLWGCLRPLHSGSHPHTNQAAALPSTGPAPDAAPEAGRLPVSTPEQR